MIPWTSRRMALARHKPRRLRCWAFRCGMSMAFDSALATNPKVEKACTALWTFLRDRQACPARVEWSAEYQHKKWGVDDYFAAGHTLADLLTMIPPSDPASEWWRSSPTN